LRGKYNNQNPHASTATAKKWPRLFNPGFSDPGRMYASCTVLRSVCGFLSQQRRLVSATVIHQRRNCLPPLDCKVDLTGCGDIDMPMSSARNPSP
jgi:hypothetical protein